MPIDRFTARLPQILAVPPELWAYERWLERRRHAAGAARDYLFAEERPRFEPRKEDVVVALPGLEVRRGPLRLFVATPAVEIALEGVSRGDAERLVDAIDGVRSLLEVRWHARVSPEVLARFLRASFGRVVLAPAAVAALESALPGAEIVRFPVAPYGIERPYWENMIAVRRRFEARRDALDDADAFLPLLRELHVIALMGETLERFYKPASPVADEVVAPGALYLSAPRLLETASGTLFLDGPRVMVPLLGGAAYHAALCRSLDDEEALADSRSFDDDGLSWGRVVTARSERDETPAAMFCPPRPIERAHLELLRAELAQAATATDAQAAMSAAARFHQAFVRLHPFHCANQSLAMNLVNAVAKRAHGAGLPHLLLDHLALRLSTGAYEEVFGRAIRSFALCEPDPARRLGELLERKRRSLALIERLASGQAPSDDPDAARWALLVP